MPRHSGSIIPGAPDFPGRVITIKIGSAEFGKRLFLQHNSPRQRPCLGMMMFEHRFDMRCGPKFSVQIEWMASFVDRPTIVLPLANQVHLLPKVLSIIADPDVSLYPVSGHPPGISQAKSPGFRGNPRLIHKRVICGYRIRPLIGWVFEINPQHLGGEVRHFLSPQIRITVRGSISRGHIEHSVETKCHGDPIMSVRWPLDDRGF